MDQFEQARIRHERRASKQVMDMGQVFEGTLHLPKKQAPDAPVVTVPKPKPSKKNADEIHLRFVVGDREIALAYETRITGALMDSQINKDELGRMFLKILSDAFGRATLK